MSTLQERAKKALMVYENMEGYGAKIPLNIGEIHLLMCVLSEVVVPVENGKKTNKVWKALFYPRYKALYDKLCLIHRGLSNVMCDDAERIGRD